MTDDAMIEPEANFVLKVSSVLHGERVWRRVGTRDHTTRDERSVALAIWRSACVICGDPFEVMTPLSISSADRSKSFLTTTCLAHRMTRVESNKLRFAKPAARPALFEAMQRQKLAVLPASPNSTTEERMNRWE